MKVELLPGYPQDVVASYDQRVFDLITRKRVSAAVWVCHFNAHLARAASALQARDLRRMGFGRHHGERESGESLRQFMLYGDVPETSPHEHPVMTTVRFCDDLFLRYAPYRGPIRMDVLDERTVVDDFHIDGLKLRLWTTLNYAGPEWLARRDVDYRAFEQGRNGQMCRDRGRIRSVPPQAIVLFKGWQYPGHQIKGKPLLDRRSAMGWAHRSTLHVGGSPRVSLAWHYA